MRKDTRLMRVDAGFYRWVKAKSRELRVSGIVLTSNIPKGFKFLED